MRLAAKEMQVAIDLDCRLLRGFFSVGFVAQQGEQHEVDRFFAGTNQIVKQMLLSGQNAPDTVCVKLRVGLGLHCAVHLRPSFAREQWI